MGREEQRVDTQVVLENEPLSRRQDRVLGRHPVNERPGDVGGRGRHVANRSGA